ncbi:MAG TPA: hypothetical protein DCG34_08260 [Clostridiales bacterium]|nr:hypothetical protein [Clostridiales bacterium]
MDKISVIIPVYNTADYLDKCISSVVNQSHYNLEIIVVNDGSSDSSGEIIELWTRKDSRILNFHQQNGGVSSARNTGLSMASGRYVYFLDSDDWIEDIMLETMYRVAIDSDFDLVSCNLWYEFVNGRELGIKSVSSSAEIVNLWQGADLFFDYLSPLSPGGYLGNKIFKLSIIKNHRIAFVDSSFVGGEDAYFNLCFFTHVKKSALIGQPFHHYHQRAGSAIHKARPEIISQYVNMISRFIDYCTEKSCEEKLKTFFPHLLYHFYSLGIQTAIETRSIREDILRFMAEGSANPSFEPVIKQLLTQHDTSEFWNGYKGQNSFIRRFRVKMFVSLSLSRRHKTLLMMSKVWLQIRKSNGSSENRLFVDMAMGINPLVSIIMPVFNSEAFLNEAVDSVINQTYKNWQLIIVDDASTDGSCILARKLAHTDERVIVIENQINLGVSESRNKGIKIAKGEWIAFLDSDDIWTLDKLQHQLKLAEDKEADFIYSDIYMKENGYQRVKSSNALPKIAGYKNIRKGNYIACSSVLIRKDVIKQYQFEKSELHEDYILWLKILASGTLAYCSEKPLVTIRLRKDSRSGDKKLSILKAYRGYRYVGMGIFNACFCTATNAFRAIRKYSFYRIRRKKSKY